MSESHDQKGTPSPPQQDATDQPKPVEKDEFMDALKNKEGNEGLKDAFRVLCKGSPTTTLKLKGEDLQRAVSLRGGEISVENAKEIIQLVNKQGLFSCEDFVYIVNMGVVKKDGDVDGLKKAFSALRKARPTVGVEDVQIAVTIRFRDNKDENFSENAKKTVQEVNKEGSFNCEEFLQIFKLLEHREAGQTKKIHEKLKNMNEHETITLYGRAGVGKTWVAREVANLAVRERDFDAAIWVYLNRIYKDDDMSLQESIAYQLSVLADFEDAEAKKAKEEEEAKKKEPEKKGVGAEEITIEGLIVKKLEGKNILFVLDGDGDGSRMKGEVVRDMKKMKDKDVEQQIYVLKLTAAGGEVVRLELGVLNSYKVMKTARKDQLGEGNNGVMVTPLTWEESKLLATRAMGREEDLARYFMFRSERLPSQLLLISRIVSYFVNKGEPGLQKLRDDRVTIKKEEKDVKLLDVLIKGYEERLPKSVLIDCYGPDTPENHFMRRGRAVSYNEVICYWIMEGHLGSFHRVDEAYHKGHRVLMELMDCGLLQKQEADCVAPSGATTFTFHINDYKDFFSGIRPGTGVTFDMRLGRVALGDGMIRTISRGTSRTSKSRDKQLISALLLDGNRIGEEERPTESLSEHKDLVEILAISDPTSQHFKLPILEMKKLRLLALRGCQFLESLDPFLPKKPDQVKEQSPQKSDTENEKPPVDGAPMEGLTVVEISGPNSQIKSIPGEIFDLMRNLKTVNLSYLLQVKSLPLSFYSLTQIEFLILRGCKSLQELKSLKSFKDLKILDVSESTSFEKFEDKSLHTNTKLQILNLSKTNLKTLPLINQLNELKFVWLKDCPELPRIRKIDKMRNLQIFDISGAGEVERFCDPSLEDLSELLIVDISRTKIRRLPANLGDPTYLYAKNCLKLRVVPPVEGLKKLEVLDLSGCINLREVRKEFFANVKLLRDLNLSGTKVQQLPFLSDRSFLRRLVLSGCELLEKVEKLGCLKELEFLDLSGCKKVTELEEGSFDEMKYLEHLNLSGTSIGKSLPSLSKLENLKQLHVRDCPKLIKLPGVEEVPNLEVLDCSGTVLESPPRFSKDHRPSQRFLGEGIERIDKAKLFGNLGAKQDGVEGPKPCVKREEVSKCNWIISNWRIGDTEKLGTPVYGAHFLRLLGYPSFLTQNLSKFCFLVYPSEAQAKVEDRFPKDTYVDEVNLREIYFEQVCEEKMERCLEIREFKELPKNLGPLIAQAQFVVLVDDPFLKSLLDLRVDSSTIPMKACWIESCSELEYVVAAPPSLEKKTGEAAKGEGEQGKNGKPMELAKGGGDQGKKVAAEKAKEVAGKGGGDQKKKAEDGKAGEPAKNEGDQQKNVAGDEPNNAAADNSGESAKGKGDQQKNAAEEKTGVSAKSEGDQQKTTAAGDTEKIGGDQPKNAAADNSGESAKDKGDQQKNAAEEKSGVSAKSEGDQPKTTAAGDTEKIGGDQPKNAAPDNSGESAIDKGDQQKNAADEKSEDVAKSEGDQQNASAADTEKIGGDEPKNAAEEKSGDAAKREGDEQKAAAADTTKIGGDELKNAAEEKSGDAAKNEGDQQSAAAAAADTAKIGGDQLKNAAEEKAGDSAKSEGDQHKTSAADEKPGEPAKNEGNQPKNAAEDGSGEPGGDQQKNTAEEKSGDAAKNEGEEAKNPAEDLNKLETLWISDVSNMRSVCKGDIKSVSFEFLKSLYLEYCPELSEICSSSLQLRNLKTLFIKYCQKLVRLFEDEKPSEMEQLGHLQLWGLDKLQKINCKTPLLKKLRVGECPLLEHVITSTVTDSQVENKGHENLETLHIKSCDNLKSIIEVEHGDNYVVLNKLKELELSGLPKLQKVAMQAQSLLVLRVGDCPSLTSVIADAYVVRDLETLEVKTCEKLNAIIEGSASVLLKKVKKIELLGLPELEKVGAKLPKNEGNVIWACPKLQLS